ncbi:HTH-type transcriptional repressor CytR [Abditibacteriota bacterium]|nr:HTH-type transcriptional repressor CytR [Abditibacteriota bacterium]
MRNSSPHTTRATTLQDVADKASVGLSTASYVLNNKPKAIGVETRERVWRAARELGYRPNMAARSLVTRQTHIIALGIPSVATAFSARVIAEIQKQAGLHGYDVMICDTDRVNISLDLEPPHSHSAHTVPMPLWNVDGVIAFFGSASRNIEGKVQGPPTLPIVSMGTFFLPHTDFAGLSLFQASSEAVEWLLEAKRQRIGFLVPSAADFMGDERHEAYESIMRKAGRTPIFIHTEQNSRVAAYETMREFLRDNEPVDGLFCYNDYAAIGASRALREAGLSIPTQVLLVGCDGIEDIDYLDWTLPTIELPIPQMCACAWEFLQQRLSNPALPLQKKFFSGQFRAVAR